MKENEIGKVVVDCAVRLHMELGQKNEEMTEVGKVSSHEDTKARRVE